jgi:hypothetical protein
MMIPVTVSFMKEHLPLDGQHSVEPVKIAPSACMKHIDKKRIEEFQGWPDASFIAEARRSQSHFQNKVVGDSDMPWSEVLRRAMNDGTLAYTMENTCGREMARERIDFELSSREMALARRALWKTECHREPRDDFYPKLIEQFGEGCIWYAEEGWEHWAGQPLIACRSQEELDDMCARLEGHEFPVLAVMRMDEPAPARFPRRGGLGKTRL